ncbi:hypothetical protein CGC58_11560 [Capnocytophaga stomatis]|uniref:Uncharacterized protein n=1 Tax=Capnocytophaga stomatis TaxID=1848904 RepID=A0A250FYW5_9FLAO|nr:hypothetical protein [Capnocytophaga stomatis]ATA90310.1 hypothetical protein CGC58_11560 [Capnocytophaga stomatis]
MPGTDNLNNDFTQEEKDLFDAHLSSTEAQKVEQEQEEELQAQQDKLIVVDGARYRFGAHLAELKVLNDTPTIQGKLVGTVVENQPTNFTFADGFQLTSLGQWTGQGTAKFQNNEVLIQGSKISYVGQMPGSSTVEAGTAECIHSGQINVPECIDTTFAPLPPYKTRPKITNGRWASDRNAANEITEAYLEDTVYFVIDTVNIEDGEKLTVQLYDYDHFLWNDLWNFDDKIDSPREIKVKNNQAVMEVYLKPQWKEHIDAEKGQPFANSAIELYWKISCDNKKISKEIFPREIYNHLKVRNQREIYIKPVMSETGYNYGVPEIYSFDGDPMFFAGITEMKVVEESSENEFVGYGKSFLISGAAYLGDKKLPDVSKGIAMAKYEAGYRVNHSGKMVRYDDFEKFLSSQKSLRQFIPLEKKVVNGVDQLAIMQTKLPSTQTFYFLKNAANIFGSLYSLTEVAKGGRDMNSVLSDALVLASNSTPVLGILTKMTLDVMQTPVKEFFDDLKNDYIKELNVYKFSGVNDVRSYLSMRKNQTKLLNEYNIAYISYQGMQGLLNGSIRDWKQLNRYSKFDEVAILCISKEEYTIIDSFFVKPKTNNK